MAFESKREWRLPTEPEPVKDRSVSDQLRREVRGERLTLGYVALLIVAVLLFLAIRYVGEQAAQVVASPTEVATRTSNATPHPLPHILGALIAIIATARCLGVAFHWIGQPRVIGEVVAGIVLGPSLLGSFFPNAVSFVLPQNILPHLSILAQLGVILYMFLVGLELNSELLRDRAQATIAISHASIVLPFTLGAGLALWAFPRFAPPGVSFTSFSLFLGAAMAITAFPVLARILTDRGMAHTELGVVALSCAAADDVTAWCLLAFVVGVAQADVGGALTTLGLALGYIVLMFWFVRPWIARLLHLHGEKEPSHDITAWVLIAVLASALVTELIGIHAIFGAFLLGAVIPHESHVARSFRHKLEDVVSILLLPAFFAYTGMRTQIDLLSHGSDWVFCAIIIGVATLGKFGGTVAAARFTGLSWPMAGALGILMNTRGLMELIVLNIGLDLGIISPILFAMMVIMALVTTIATTPILQQITRLGLMEDSTAPNAAHRST